MTSAHGNGQDTDGAVAGNDTDGAAAGHDVDGTAASEAAGTSVRTLPSRASRRAAQRRERRRRVPVAAGIGGGLLGVAAMIVLVGLPLTSAPSGTALAQGRVEVVPGEAAGTDRSAEDGAGVGAGVGAGADEVVAGAIGEAADDLGVVLVPADELDVYLARDPFDPVVPEPEPGPTPEQAASGAVAATGLDGSSTELGEVPPGSAEAGTELLPPSEGGCFGEQEVVCDGRVVTLVDTDTDDHGGGLASVQVDDEIHDGLRRGDTFATSFRVLGIDGGCVSLLYGDDGFLLCEGDAVLK